VPLLRNRAWLRILRDYRLMLHFLANDRTAEQPVVFTERAEAERPGAKRFGFQTGREVSW